MRIWEQLYIWVKCHGITAGRCLWFFLFYDTGLISFLTAYNSATSHLSEGFVWKGIARFPGCHFPPSSSFYLRNLEFKFLTILLWVCYCTYCTLFLRSIWYLKTCHKHIFIYNFTAEHKQDGNNQSGKWSGCSEWRRLHWHELWWLVHTANGFHRQCWTWGEPHFNIILWFRYRNEINLYQQNIFTCVKVIKKHNCCCFII